MATKDTPPPKVRGKIEWGNKYVGYSVVLEDGGRTLVRSRDQVIEPPKPK